MYSLRKKNLQLKFLINCNFVEKINLIFQEIMNNLQNFKNFLLMLNLGRNRSLIGNKLFVRLPTAVNFVDFLLIIS